MSDIEKLKEDRKKALAKLDAAMDACDPEHSILSKTVSEMEIDFLTSWKNHKNQKITEQEFLQISNKFAQTLESQKQMTERFRKTLLPLQKEFKKICDSLHDLEEKS